MKKLALFLFASALWAQAPIPSPVNVGGSGGGGVSGSGTTGFLSKFTASTAIGNSVCDEGITTASILTCTLALAVPAVSTGTSPPSVTAGTGGVTAYKEGTVPSVGAGSAVDICYADSTSHALLCSFNNSSYFLLPLASPAFTAQTDAATVTWAIGSAFIANASLTFTVHSGSRTLNITGPVAGGSYQLKLIQDGTGGEGLTLGTGCTWKVVNAGSGAVTLSTGSAAIDMLAFTYDGTNCYAALGKNFN